VLAGFSALFPSAVELPVQSLGHCALSGGDSAKQANTSGMRRRASREGDRPIDFLKCRVVIFFDSYFFEGGLLNCINCNPAPCGTRNHLYEALLNSRLASADSGNPVGAGDCAKRCLSEDPAPAAYSAVLKIG